MFRVTALRRLVLDHRMFAAWILALALLMKVVVPTGYMIGISAGSLTIELCGDHGPIKTSMASHMTMHGMSHDMGQHTDKPDHQGKEIPCAFSGLSAPSLAAADPILLIAAIAFIMATVFRVTIEAGSRTPVFLRPPSRGPPLQL